MQYTYRFLDMNSESSLRDYLNTGKTKLMVTDAPVSEESLETQLNNIQEGIMSQQKQAISVNINMIKAVVDNLRASNPNVSTEQIIEYLKKKGYGLND